MDASHTFYDLFTGPFTVSVGNQTTVKSKTALTLSRSSAGFIRSDQSLKVNSNNSQDPSPIVAFAGTTSLPITISLATPATFPFKLVPSVSPSSNEILITSPNNFTFDSGSSTVTFNVVVVGSASEGLYWLSFVAAERGGLVSLRPSKTPLKITKLKDKLLILVDDLPVVAKGAKSDPIHVRCQQPPASELVVNITASSPSISVTPNSFKMTGEISEFDFQIIVSENANLTTQLSLDITLSGSDASLFRIPTNLPFNITEPIIQVSNSTLKALGINACQRTVCSMTPIVTTTSPLYWHLRPKGMLALSFSQIKARLTESIGNFTSDLDKERASENYLFNLYSARESTPHLTETFPDFQARLLRQHLRSDWVGLSRILNSEASATYRFYWLFPETEYDVTAYLDNGTRSPQSVTESFKTYLAYASQPFKVGLKNYSAGSSLRKDIKDLAAQQQGVPAYQLGYLDSPSKRLQSGGFSYVLYTDLNNQKQNPASQAKISGPALEQFKRALNSLGVELDSIDNLPIPPRVPPKWVHEPSVNGTNQTAVLVSLRADSAGKSCCIADSSSANNPSPQQVKAGLSAENVAVPSGCVRSNPNSEGLLLITNLTEVSPYSIFCIAHDDTPITPTYMKFDNNEVPGFMFNTTVPMSDISNLGSLVSLTLWSIAISLV